MLPIKEDSYMKALIISSLVIAGLIWASTGNAVIAGILLLTFFAIDVIVYKEFV